MKHASKIIILGLSLILFFSCNEKSKAINPKPKDNSNSDNSKLSYQKSLLLVDSISKNLNGVGQKQRGQIFANAVDKYIIPYWIGTPWDYNGVTQIPNQGFIACGYFVTTVLRDAGIPIQRVKMAQCASETMIRSLTNRVQNYSKFTFSDFIKEVKSKGIGLSVIGLDNHTGFLYFDGKELYFIHPLLAKAK